MKEKTIYSIRDSQGVGQVNCSRGEIEFCSYISDKLKKMNFQCYTAYSQPEPKKFGGIIPDMIAENESAKIAYFFHGCQVHGHFHPSCNINSSFSNRSTRNMYKKTFGEMEKRFQIQSGKLINQYGFTKIVVMWECQFNKLKEGGDDESSKIREESLKIKNFLAAKFTSRPKERLIPRECLRGGKVEVICYKYNFKTIF